MADPRELFGERRLPDFLGGRRVDRYIPPELRQGIGTLLYTADMLNPFSALYDYRVAMSRGDYPEAAAHALGFAAPGVGAALVSKGARPAMSAAAPYADDAARVLMETLSPLGAMDDLAARGYGEALPPTGAPEGLSRRNFLLGAGAAGVTASAVPSGGITDLIGRAVPRAAARAVDAPLALARRIADASTAYDAALAKIYGTRTNSTELEGFDEWGDYRTDALGFEYADVYDKTYNELMDVLARTDLKDDLSSLSDEELDVLSEYVDYERMLMFRSRSDGFNADPKFEKLPEATRKSILNNVGAIEDEVTRRQAAASARR